MSTPFLGTVVQWLKEGSPVSSSDHDEIAQGNKFASNLTIMHIKQEGLTNYNCFCFYNESIVISQRQIVSNATMSVPIHAIEGKLPIYVASGDILLSFLCKSTYN